MRRILLLSAARSGSTYLTQLLNCHQNISFAGELLNTEVELEDGDTFRYLENHFLEIENDYVGFKVLLEHLISRNLPLDNLLHGIRASHLIILWRENLIDTVVSYKIAKKTGKWYSSVENSDVNQIVLQPKSIDKYCNTLIQYWKQIAKQLPIDTAPIFVTYEQLVKDPTATVKSILQQMSLDSSDIELFVECKKQNPAALSEKVINWNTLSTYYRSLQIDVSSIFQQEIKESLQILPDKMDLVPEREPCCPPGGWKYRVAEPFIPAEAKECVLNALDSASVSSAGHWPTEFARLLANLFQVPTVQPCCNGFAALVLALQAAEVGPHHEVICPSFTMVAVANAVSFVGSVPVFVDNAKNAYNPSWIEIEAAASDRTRAVIVCHTYGVFASDIELISRECQRRSWILIEDTSECVGLKVKCQDGGRTKFLGTFGDFACASLYANKIIHAGDGGFVLARNAACGAKLASLVNHGFTKSYHFLHFQRCINAKINGLGAAMACGCLSRLDEIIEHRKSVCAAYRKAISRIAALKAMPACSNDDCPWVFGIECQSKNERTKLRTYLASNGIETRDYFFPLHLQPAYRSLYLNRNANNCFQNAEKLGSVGFYLPTHSNLRQIDIEYITSIIFQYFGVNVVVEEPTSSTLNLTSIRIKPGEFGIEARDFSNEQSQGVICSRTHPLRKAATLANRAETHLYRERWDDAKVLLEEMSLLLEECKPQKFSYDVESFFRPYIDYMATQTDFEPCLESPWVYEDLLSPEFSQCHKIPTTTDEETRKLIIWLVKTRKPETILELGCWFGHTTLLMAVAAGQQSNCRIYAAEAFKWQKWMEQFYPKESLWLKQGNSFLKAFQSGVESEKDKIQAVLWPYDIQNLPPEFTNIKFDLIYLDFSQIADDVSKAFELLRPCLTPNRTVIVLNCITRSLLPFLTNYKTELKPLYKPHALAKVFLFVENQEVVSLREKASNIDQVLHLPRKFNFANCPDWSHHHQNAFEMSILQLKALLHDGSAPILFIPAVEDTLCDYPDVFRRSWIGIIHSTPEYHQHFYVPDLTKLCGRKYDFAMQKCKGLFTLTHVQANFLRQHLNFAIPICPILYPLVEPSSFDTNCDSELIKNWYQPQQIDIILIGSYARDFDYFFHVELPKEMRKVLLISDENSRKIISRVPNDVHILNRLSDEEYEKALKNSIVFLSLQHDGAANTIILECIARNTPILLPNLESCIEYIGQNYPLFYMIGQRSLTELLSFENVKSSVEYLKSIDKSKYSVAQFCKSVLDSSVLYSIPPITAQSCFTFDVTVCVCSYKRTHHLKQILNRLWNGQSFQGSFQIILWNNNQARSFEIREICEKYLRQKHSRKHFEVIDSTENHYCAVRFAMPHLMKSDQVLICDDDVVPGENFISFFHQARKLHPNDVLCVRGHRFLPHLLDNHNPGAAWRDYESLRFVADAAPEQCIHFVHADVCMISKQALMQCGSVPIPDPEFYLVDDYWMSFVLNHTFKVALRKLHCPPNDSVLQRTDDSDTPGLALHTRPEVRDVRIRLYIYHMLQGWPQWSDESSSIPLNPIDDKELKHCKMDAWKQVVVGYNINSEVTTEDVEMLHRMGVKLVRIGAVGCKKEVDYELSGLLVEPDKTIAQLTQLIQHLNLLKIDVVLTLERRLARADVWLLIAAHFAQFSNVIGYDLINEPQTELDILRHWTELSEGDKEGIEGLLDSYKQMIAKIRSVDLVTPVVIEPSYWAHIESVPNLLASSDLTELDDNLILSVHFYEPMKLTQRRLNDGRYQFPGLVPVYNSSDYDQLLWDQSLIDQKVQNAVQLAGNCQLKVFVGEVGIARDIPGAADYLSAVISSCWNAGVSCCIYSFRDIEWEAMNYEFGTDFDQVSYRIV